MAKMRSCSAVFRTELGWAGVSLSEQGIRALVLPRKNRGSVLRDLAMAGGDGPADAGPAASCSPELLRIADQVKKFLEGGAEAVAAHPDLQGYTRFQRAVWKAAQEIPYGETRSYGWIAKRIGKPTAARAVGQAMGANPVPILVP